MSRFWSILFFLVPILGIATTVMAMLEVPPFGSAWLPPSLSLAGDSIDQLFNGIHLLSAVILLGTGLTIAWAVWKFDHRRSDAKKALYIHHNTKLEIVWTIIPAFILIFLAYFQMKSWRENKMDRPVMMVDGESVPVPPMVMVKAKRFGWEFFYAGEDGLVETQDDIYIENLLVLPAGEDVVLQLESRDVIHSFYVPELRLKQDIVPGMTQFAWFNARETGDIEVLCTELCGWGHYKMKADLRLVDRSTFDQWIAERSAEYLPEYKSTESPDLTLEVVSKLETRRVSEVKFTHFVAPRLLGNCTSCFKPFVVPPLGGIIMSRLKPVLRTISDDPCNFLLRVGLPKEVETAVSFSGDQPQVAITSASTNGTR